MILWPRRSCALCASPCGLMLLTTASEIVNPSRCAGVGRLIRTKNVVSWGIKTSCTSSRLAAVLVGIEQAARQYYIEQDKKTPSSPAPMTTKEQTNIKPKTNCGIYELRGAKIRCLGLAAPNLSNSATRFAGKQTKLCPFMRRTRSPTWIPCPKWARAPFGSICTIKNPISQNKRN